MLGNFPQLGEGVYNVKVVVKDGNGKYVAGKTVARAAVSADTTFGGVTLHIEHWHLVDTAPVGDLEYEQFPAVSEFRSFEFRRVGDYQVTNAAPDPGLGVTPAGVAWTRWRHTAQRY